MKSDIGLVERLAYIARHLEWRALRLGFGACPVCGPSAYLRFRADPLGIRCIRCGGAPFALAAAHAVRERFSDLSSCSVYEASSRGPLFAFLSGRSGQFAFSEYIEGVPAGSMKDGVCCQDLQALAYANDSFDLCTSTEVIEHVADDRQAFLELLRVLKPAGYLIFTVPLFDADETLERAEQDPLSPGGVRFIHEAQYHDDRIKGPGSALVYRDYGRDILDRLREAGFSSAEFAAWRNPAGLGREVQAVVARKASAS